MQHGFKYRCNSQHPNVEIIKRYLELGGKHITIGSDAHRLGAVGVYFDRVYDLLKSLNINEITVYEKRKPVLKTV